MEFAGYKVKQGTLKCKKHGAYHGFTMNGIGSECPVCAAETVEKERVEREQAMRKSLAEARMKSIFDRSSFPKLFKSIEFADYKPRNKAAEEILERMTAYAENFGKIRELGSSVLFIGGTGTGKSMLAAATGNAIMLAGYTVMYLTCPQALSWVKRSWVNGSEVSQDEYLNRFKEPDLLILDEVPKGCKSASDWELIHEVLDRRYQDVRPTISISTLSEQELEKKMTREITRRMYFRGRKLLFNWEPYEETGLLW
jgi:DNA replication protein DnaC